MVYNSNILLITTDTSVTNAHDVYLVDATSQNITITLPSINSDGTNYLFNRIDNTDNTVGITGSNIIFGATAGYSLDIGVFGIESYNNIWYPFIYNDIALLEQVFPFSFPTFVAAATGLPAVMGNATTNPPTNLGGLVPSVGTSGYFSLSCSPWYIPWTNFTLTDITFLLGGVAITSDTKTFPMFCRINIVKIGLSNQTIVATNDINIGATAGSSIGEFNDAFSSIFDKSLTLSTSLALTRGLYGLTFVPVSATNYISAIRNFFGTVTIMKA